MHLVKNIGDKDIKQEANRKGFGRGLLEAGRQDNKIVALCADLTESTQILHFAEAFPERYFNVGVAEQNLVTVASGMAAMGKIPFASSYAAFCPGRCWEQIRTTIALNEQPVKLIGSHAGISVGPDGATHQMLEDIALMRTMPNMVVVAPSDSIEAEKATKAIAKVNNAVYMRLSRADSPVFTTEQTPFELGKAYIYHEGADIAIMATGTMTYQALVAAKVLKDSGISALVLHVPTIKPLDESAVVEAAKKCGRVVTVEEAQIAGGFGSAVTELLSEFLPMPILRLGMKDRFGESGEPNELLDHFGLLGEHIAKSAKQWCERMPQFYR
ncbi:MAG TPA: transketolase family protein [Candidatus Saccharimonadales bacterium]|nr:transketolase family protein [Candidatus Saccharimonadales bacterium]